MQERCVAQSGGTIRLPPLVDQQRKRNAGLFAEDAGVAQIAQTNGGEARPLLPEFPLVFAQLRERFYEFMRRHGQELKSECYIPTTVNELVATGVARVKVLRTPSSWFGVTYQEDKPRITAGIRGLIARCEYPQKLWE